MQTYALIEAKIDWGIMSPNKKLNLKFLGG
jgi:hypothetical protein